MVAEADGVDFSFRPLDIVGRLPDRSVPEALGGGSRAVIGAGFCRLLGYLGVEDCVRSERFVNLWRRVNLLTPMW